MKFHNQKRNKKGVSVIIINNQGKILVLKRSQKEKSFPCLWDLPGGGVKEKETLKAAAKREVKEESSLDVKLEKKYFYVFHCKDCQNKNFNIYGFRAHLSRGNILLSEEHAEFKWIAKKERENFQYTPSVKATIEEFFR